MKSFPSSTSKIFYTEVEECTLKLKDTVEDLCMRLRSIKNNAEQIKKIMATWSKVLNDFFASNKIYKN